MTTTARRRKRRRHPMRRALASLGLWGWLVIAGVALLAVQWLLAHLIVLAMLLCSLAVAGALWVMWRTDARQGRMTPGEFEHHVAGLLRRDGCYDVQVIGGAGDLGADVIATTPAGLRVVAQCKRYGSKHAVGSPEVQTFGGTARPVHRAHIACMVTTSRFTQPAREYAASMGIQLIDGRALQAWRSGIMPAPWN